MRLNLLFYILCISQIFPKCFASEFEFYSAQSNIEDAVKSQNLLIQSIEDYLERDGKIKEEIRNIVHSYKIRSLRGSKEITENSINSYHFIKGLTQELDFLNKIISQTKNETQELEDKILQIRNSSLFPKDEDLTGAIKGLNEIKTVYLLSTSDLTKGLIKDDCCAERLTYEDCFKIGFALYNSSDYTNAILWFKEAIKLYRAENQVPKPKKSYSLNIEKSPLKTETDFLEYLALSYGELRNSKNAIRLNKKILEIDPTHKRAKNNIKYLERLREFRKEKNQPKIVKEKTTDDLNQERFMSLCRGEYLPRIYMKDSDFKCQYVHNNNFYMLIGPFKEEIVNMDPKILLYHDVLSDREIKRIISASKPKLERATVNGPDGNLIPHDKRVSQSAWLKEKNHRFIKKINQRIGHIAGLSISTAEIFQVVNYGIGGSYHPHFDYTIGSLHHIESVHEFDGNRVATFLMYLNDVEKGGGTVFPYLNVTVLPKKGSAIFWYNLFHDSMGDKRTIHAGCPILLGQKWVANKWFHERGQEFIRPCELKRSVNIKDGYFDEYDEFNFEHYDNPDL